MGASFGQHLISKAGLGSKENPVASSMIFGSGLNKSYIGDGGLNMTESKPDAN